jgi:hypothetical protein
MRTKEDRAQLRLDAQNPQMHLPWRQDLLDLLDDLDEVHLQLEEAEGTLSGLPRPFAVGERVELLGRSWCAGTVKELGLTKDRLLVELDEADRSGEKEYWASAIHVRRPRPWENYQPPRLPEQDRLDKALAHLERMTPEQVAEMSVAGIQHPNGGTLKRVTFTLTCPFCENSSTHPLTPAVMTQSPGAILEQLQRYAAHHAECSKGKIAPSRKEP